MSNLSHLTVYRFVCLNTLRILSFAVVSRGRSLYFLFFISLLFYQFRYEMVNIAILNDVHGDVIITLIVRIEVFLEKRHAQVLPMRISERKVDEDERTQERSNKMKRKKYTWSNDSELGIFLAVRFRRSRQQQIKKNEIRTKSFNVFKCYQFLIRMLTNLSRSSKHDSETRKTPSFLPLEYTHMYAHTNYDTLPHIKMCVFSRSVRSSQSIR